MSAVGPLADGAQSTNEMVAAGGRPLAAGCVEPSLRTRVRPRWLAGLLAWLGSRACSLRPGWAPGLEGLTHNSCRSVGLLPRSS
jgi:hypothetical protein